MPPNVTGIPNKEVTVDEGEHLVLSCQASGTSPLVFTWSYKGDGGNMPHPSYTANDGSLHIDHVTASARGRYTCEVRNAAGSAKYETNVDISKWFIAICQSDARTSTAFLFLESFQPFHVKINYISNYKIPLPITVNFIPFHEKYFTTKNIIYLLEAQTFLKNMISWYVFKEPCFLD